MKLAPSGDAKVVAALEVAINEVSRALGLLRYTETSPETWALASNIFEAQKDLEGIRDAISSLKTL